mgnify:CR=1 FL=1
MWPVRHLMDRRTLNRSHVRQRTQMGNVILYIATSLDGFIARRNDDISWLTAYDGPNEDYGYAAFYARVGAIIPVSYTHLRAHETVLDLVCRLLLQKKNKQKQKRTKNKKTRTYSYM